MSLEELEREIASNASKEASAIDARASEEAESIISEAKSKAAALTSREREELAKQLENQMSEAKSAMQILSAAEVSRSIGASAERSYKKLYLLTEKRVKRDYGKLVASALREAGHLFDGMAADVVVEAGGKAYDEINKSKCKYPIKKSKTEGIMLRSRDSTICVDSTMESILASRADLMHNLLKAHVRERASKFVQQAEVQIPAKNQNQRSATAMRRSAKKSLKQRTGKKKKASSKR
jgi:vacuolar-type H+-ATPase subunit E/Vma4